MDIIPQTSMITLEFFLVEITRYYMIVIILYKVLKESRTFFCPVFFPREH